jgi:hypothetical protein
MGTVIDDSTLGDNQSQFNDSLNEFNTTIQKQIDDFNKNHHNNNPKLSAFAKNVKHEQKIDDTDTKSDNFKLSKHINYSQNNKNNAN